MKNTKKVLSVVLAVVMALSALTLVAFAHSYTGVEDNANSTSVRYEVTQVASATDVNGGTYTAVDNDIYAVTIYAKAKAGSGILYFQVPIQYDKTLFEPMMLVDSGDLYCAQDGWFTDIGITATDFYTNPARYSDTNMYKADGSVATKIQAKSYMLGNSNAGPWTYQAEYVGPDDGRYDFWADGLTAAQKTTTGLMFVALDDGSFVAKTAYLNTDAGLLITNDYLPMTTVYFHRIDGITEEQCYGAEFGVKTTAFAGTSITSCKNASAAGYVAADYDPTYIEDVNYINGAVEAAVKPLVALTATNGAKQQGLAFKLATAAVTDHTNNATPYTEASIASVDYRFVAQFSTSAFTLDYDTDGKITNTNLDEVGFVLTRTDSGVTAADIALYNAAQVSALTKDSGDVRKCWTQNLSTGMAGGAAFAFTCRITGIGAADSSQPLVGTFSADNVSPGYIAVPYVLTNNGDIYFGQAMTVLKADILARYTNNVSTFLTKANLS